MKSLFLLIIVFAVAVWIGVSMHHDPGVLVVTFAGWRLDTPLWLGLFIILLFCIILYYVLSVISGFINASKTIRNFFASYKKQKAKRVTQKGLVALAENNWVVAERFLIQGALYSEMPSLNYLFAAKAALEQGAQERSDCYLQHAHEKTTETEMAIGLTMAHMQKEQGQYKESLTTLMQLYAKSPEHPSILRLLTEIYKSLGTWKVLKELLPKIKQGKILSLEKFNALEYSVWFELLKTTWNEQGYDAAQSLWQKMPKRLQQKETMILLQAQALLDYEKMTEAEIFLKEALKDQWSEKYIRIYGQLIHPEPQKLIKTAENWLKEHPDSPGLLLTLARLCVQHKLWGKAQRYFEDSLNLVPDPQGFAELGALFETMDKPEMGAYYFKKGLMLTLPACMPELLSGDNVSVRHS